MLKEVSGQEIGNGRKVGVERHWARQVPFRDQWLEQAPRQFTAKRFVQPRLLNAGEAIGDDQPGEDRADGKREPQHPTSIAVVFRACLCPTSLPRGRVQWVTARPPSPG